MRVGLAYHKDMLRHDPGESHPEQPQRLTAICQSLESAGLLPELQHLPVSPAAMSDLELVHEPAYVELVRLACDEGMTFIGSPDTRICSWSYDAARLAAGAVLAACDAAMGNGPRRSFCAVRPPGHHAHTDQAGGFCLFNNVAIAAEHLIRRHGLRRVAIVDFDVHHGNGTQEIFEKRDDVLFISLHEHPAHLYPGTGQASERGRAAGEGYTLNIPLQPGSADAEYRWAFSEKVLPALDRFDPQFLLVSAGFDAAEGEFIAHMHLEPKAFEWMTRVLVGAAESHCDGRLVNTLEGGYNPDLLAPAVLAHVRALM